MAAEPPLDPSCISAAISALPTGTHTPLARRDAELWWRLVNNAKLPLQPDYGDYAVTHPTPTADGCAPNPIFATRTQGREQKAHHSGHQPAPTEINPLIIPATDGLTKLTMPSAVEHP
ncbi:MAG TPA: hypothetical protein VJT72_22835 [Pseudonocardiaceae bacterium]|nr:hypothetical protein [Pseudonocardiaceae bacterium]